MDEQIKPVAWRTKTPHGWVVGKTQHSSCDEPLYSQQSIDALRADVERLRGSLADSDAEIEFTYARAERAEAEAEALRADAERYRWLCDGNGYFMEECYVCGHENEKARADAAIDAAMKGAE